MALLTDGQARAAAVAARLTTALTTPPSSVPEGGRSPNNQRCRGQSLAQGAAGVAVLHGERARAGVGDWATVAPWLTAAAREDLIAGPGAGLWYGAPAVGFAVATANPPGCCRSASQHLDAAVERLIDTRLAAACARIDAGRPPERSEFDLVRGLAGLGAYLLTRHPHGDQVRRVLSYLVRLTEPLPAADTTKLTMPGWWSSDIPRGASPAVFADGHADLGMAHGIAGPLALLALAQRQGVLVTGHLDALDRICGWLDAWRREGPAGPWWPERITAEELRTGQPAQTGPARPSWCYGTPGLARAQQLAGLATGDHTRQQQAEDALATCLSDPAQLARVTDPALCHGWAGLVATVRCAAADARSPDLAAHLPRLLDTLLDHAEAGDSPSLRLPGLIEGTAGIAVTLHGVASGTSGPWETCLLIN